MANHLAYTHLYMFIVAERMVYENVEKLCEERNMSIRQLEVKSGLSNATIGKWRTSTPTLDSLRKVAAVLHVSIEKLIEEKGTENERND